MKQFYLKILSLMMCFVFVFNMYLFTTVNASSESIYNDNFEGDSLSDYKLTAPNGSSITIAGPSTVSDGRYISIKMPASGTVEAIFEKSITPITVTTNDTYIYETMIHSTSKNNLRSVGIFYRSGSSYSSLGTMKDKDNSLGFFDSAGTRICNLSQNTWYSMAMVLTRSATEQRIVYDLYINGEKTNTVPCVGPANIVTINAVGGSYKTWSQATETNFDNIMLSKYDGTFNTMDMKARSQNIKVSFNNTIDNTSVTSESIEVKDSNGNAVSTNTPTILNSNVIIKPSAPLADGDYTISITGIKDVLGNTLESVQSPFTINNKIVYAENDFDSEDELDDYNVTTATGTDISQTEAPDKAGESVEVSMPRNTPNLQAKISKNLTQVPLEIQSGIKYALKMKVYNGYNANSMQLFGYNGSGSNHLLSIVNSTDGLILKDYGQNQIGTDVFTPGQWLNVFLVLDGTSNTYDVYVNGVKRNLSAIALPAATANIYEVSFGCLSSGANTVTRVYYDDIRLYSLVDFELLHTSLDEIDKVDAYVKEITLEFNSIVDQAAVNNIKLATADETTTITTVNTVYANDTTVVKLTLDESLIPSKEYKIITSGLQDTLIEQESSSEKTFRTLANPVVLPSVVKLNGQVLQAVKKGNLTITVPVQNPGGYSGGVAVVAAYYAPYLLEDGSIDYLDNGQINYYQAAIQKVELSSVPSTATEVTLNINIPATVADNVFADSYLSIFTYRSVKNMQPINDVKTLNAE